jgi:protoporphyrinogen/coproporphyrinogen III oxidase
MTRVIVTGAGIAGLSIAREIRRQSPGIEVLVLEARNRIGGNIRTERSDGYLCEWGPDGFLDNAPATLQLVQELGLSSALLPSRDCARRRFIFRRGRLHEVPLSPPAFLASNLLSLRGRLRVAGEPFARPAPKHDESIYEFAARHIGHEAAEVLVGPMVSGIFAGDAHELSLKAAFPKMAEMEAAHGSLFRAMLARRHERKRDNGVGAPIGKLLSFTGGMEQLPRALAASLGDAVRLESKATGLCPRRVCSPEKCGWPVGARAFTVRAAGRSFEADAVVLAGPARESAELIQPFDPQLGALIGRIATAPLAVVCLGYDEATIAAERGPLDGFGFLVPRQEGPRILGALWESSIYDGRAPKGKALIRIMIGGATDPEAVALEDAQLIDIARRDLAQTMSLRAVPEFVRVVHHRGGIPQYTIGHSGRLSRIASLLPSYPGLFLAGNSYRGVSINSCVEDAPAIASRVVDHLRSVERAEDLVRLS